jgi:hypothetical protein
LHILGKFPSSVNLKNKNTRIRKLVLLPSSLGTIPPSQMGPLERANLNPRPGMVSPDDGNISTFRNVYVLNFLKLIDEEKYQFNNKSSAKSFRHTIKCIK